MHGKVVVITGGFGVLGRAAGQAAREAGAKPVLIEWDNDVPAFPILMAEADRAAEILRKGRVA